jgi:hypothetical protein
MRASLALLALALTVACSKGAHQRAPDARERAEAHALVARSEIVGTLASPSAPGRIIYEKPVDLSYTNLKRTRPDLDSASLVHGASTATEKQRPEASRR